MPPDTAASSPELEACLNTALRSAFYQACQTEPRFTRFSGTSKHVRNCSILHLQVIGEMYSLILVLLAVLCSESSQAYR